jgi:hypothetical protein
MTWTYSSIALLHAPDWLKAEQGLAESILRWTWTQSSTAVMKIATGFITISGWF